MFSGFSAPSFGQNYTSVPAQDWQKTFELVKNDQNPVARKLLFWLYATETTLPLSVKDLIHFSLENSGWPALYKFRDRIEKDIGTAKLRPAEIAAWFDANPPKTADGISAYSAALTSLKKDEKAAAALKKFWLEAELDKKETAAIWAKYQKTFSTADHAARLDNLLWNQRYQEAEYMLPLVGADTKKTAEARIALGRLSSKATKLVSALPAAQQGDVGLLYDRLRWRRQRDKDDDAWHLLRQAPKNPPHPDLWWKERHVLARRAIEKHDYARAYAIADNHGLSAAADLSQAEWLLGWLSLEYLNKPDRAYRHFEKLYETVTSAISRARAAYWLARAAEKMGQEKSAGNWHKISAQFPSTFYGQLSYEKLQGTLDAAALQDDQVPKDAARDFEEKEPVQAARLLAKVGLRKYADPFLTKLLERGKERVDFVLIARLAKEVERPRFIIEANKQLQQKLGEFMFTEGYPLLPRLPVREPESALIHAIMQRESMFDREALSSAGARGLMQLMPRTAKQVSKGLRKKFSAQKLTDNPEYNIEVGSTYLQHLLDSYNGSYLLAIAAYNAGPGNVDAWIRAFGDPRNGRTDTINWIEQIPIYETRNYVQRVMESYYIYKLRLSEKPRTVLGFAKG